MISLKLKTLGTVLFFIFHLDGKNRTVPILFTSAFLLLTFNFTCLAQPISSTELINDAQQYDGKIIAYEGEVIGDIMKRGDSAWVNINDGNNAIGVWISDSLAKEITYTGSYKTKGDWVEITGIFHRACFEHGGDLDIHAQAILRLSAGKNIAEKLNTGKRNLAIILAGVLAAIWILMLFKRK